MESWTDYLENVFPIDIIYTDFAKAFDRVTIPRRLLKKLNMWE